MAIFVDLDEECEPPQTQAAIHGEWDGERTKLQLQQELLAVVNTDAYPRDSSVVNGGGEAPAADKDMRENPNRNRMTEALGCYPYVKC